ncbi:Uncharacterized methyltransferase At1g78140, chloroplastic [Seminavis robusta]|uniref:Uncharacterized methyltransferase At1g78140, chloroplastic n=2 Tax=Seminavis robusta TaxID=568900 RepID=A0A9N8HE47_9STRA|nr:Uncharacterized methyltransferase At1g78140, chloroplastic [Seminavis robusta]|eukprot:Sro287_g108490.1 Uncharacterized methyltransferase At1g78140, chloroplastic (395) ;mRNA; f:8555-10031
MKLSCTVPALLGLSCLAGTNAFQMPPSSRQNHVSLQAATTSEPTAISDEAKAAKEELLQLLGTRGFQDPVLADPDTKEPIRVVTSGIIMGGNGQRKKIDLQSSTNNYRGSSDTFFNLLEAVQSADNADSDSSRSGLVAEAAKRLIPFIPPPLRSPLATAGFPVGEDYVPMRDLFTSPSVSFAYERGWRQGFAAAGFPGPDKEAEFAMDYFAPAIAKAEGSNVLVDMSCATGLFTRRFTKSGKYDRVLGCDYSASMLQEARRRIKADPSLSPERRQSQLDLVRCDVGRIPMKSESVDAFHAGAAMHCWPELPKAASEIYRVLKPGGRYFATTFLSSYFGTLQSAEGGATGPSRQAFQYFASTQMLRELMEEGGFSREKISVEVIEPSAVIIRCEK